VLIVGFDGDVAGLKAVKAGSVDATMTQQTQFMGRLALDSALKIIGHQTVPKEQLQKAILTTKDNVDQYIAKHP
jgi:ribose transport system substrate-binding protein